MSHVQSLLEYGEANEWGCSSLAVEPRMYLGRYTYVIRTDEITLFNYLFDSKVNSKERYDELTDYILAIIYDEFPEMATLSIKFEHYILIDSGVKMLEYVRTIIS